MLRYSSNAFIRDINLRIYVYVIFDFIKPGETRQQTVHTDPDKIFRLIAIRQIATKRLAALADVNYGISPPCLGTIDGVGF